jgi:EAL domain-containing protein (putative c-di-GMP-specific phosphodiesterase class I)
MNPVRVVIADDEPLVRDALGELLRSQPQLSLVGEAGDAAAAIALVHEQRPDVVLVDVKMPGGGGAAVARRLKRERPETRVVALSAYSDRETVLEMIRAGAAGYVVKGAPGTEIVETIVGCARGESHVSGTITGEILAELTHHLELEEQETAAQRERLALVERVLRRNELTMVFQPIVDLDTGELVGAEALARFPDDLSGPVAWFAAADTVGRRTELELHAAQAALAGLPLLERHAFLTVNLSPQTLAAWPSLLLEEAAARRLVLELTEHAPVDDYDDLAARLAEVRAAGIRIAVDDVGAGFANFRHILHLAPDLIKMDAALTHGIHADRSRRALASALISFAAELDATIVAEGIETQAELDTLRRLGVRHGQGYFIARPGPLPLARRSLA